MTRRPFIAGNWKMNLTPSEAASLASDLADASKEIRGVDIAIAPTNLAILSVIEKTRNTGIHVASQNHHTQSSGAYTGEVSPEMLRSVGCAYALVGHSERRQIFGESNTLINEKVHSAFRAGLLPILCVGETLAERESGQAQDIVSTQILDGLKDLSADQVAAVTIAYEPVWAIGTGKTATPESAQEMHAHIRKLLTNHYPAFVANDLRIQYGGSVKPQNAAELLAQPDIDGALVGGASLKKDSFAAILMAANSQ